MFKEFKWFKEFERLKLFKPDQRFIYQYLFNFLTVTL